MNLQSAVVPLLLSLLSLLPRNGNSKPIAPSPGCFKNKNEGIGAGIGPGETTVIKIKLPDTQRRTHSLTLPTDYKQKMKSDPAPLLMYFHGWGGNHNECGTRCTTDAAEKGFVSLTLSGYHGSWNIGGSSSSPGPEGPICEPTAGDYCYEGFSGCDCSKADNCWWTTCWDSVAQAMDVLDQVQEDICFDMNQIWAMGCSNGGMFTFDLALDERSASRIRGIIPIVGLPHYGFSYGPSVDTISMFGMWGIDDTTVPPFSNTDNPDKTLDTANSNGGWYYTSVPKVLKDWTTELGCEGEGQDTIPEDNDYGISSVDNFSCTQGCSEREDGIRAISCIFQGGHVCTQDEVSWEPAFNFMMSFSCPEDPQKKAKFWTGEKKGSGKPQRKKCQWLQKQTPEDIETYCAMTDGFMTAKPAKDVCTGTCNSC